MKHMWTTRQVMMLLMGIATGLHMAHTHNIHIAVFIKGGGPTQKFFYTLFSRFLHIYNLYKKNYKFCCRLERNQTTRGRVVHAKLKTPKLEKNSKKGHFSQFSENSKNM